MRELYEAKSTSLIEEALDKEDQYEDKFESLSNEKVILDNRRNNFYESISDVETRIKSPD